MNTRFDELTKGLAQSVTRRAALKKFGVGLAGMALACFGLVNKGNAQTTCFPSGYPVGLNRDYCGDCCSGDCTVRWVHDLSKPKHKYKVYFCA